MASPVYIAGAYEHPEREILDRSTLQIHQEVANGALEDAGLKKTDIEAYCTAGVPAEPQGYAGTSLIMVDYLGLDVEVIETSDPGGSAYISHVGTAMRAIRDGKCDVALVTLGARPRSHDADTGTGTHESQTAQDNFELIYGPSTVSAYAMAAQRHMYEFGTTSEQLAEIRVAASQHAQYNEDALYQDPVTVEDVVNSRVIAHPLHLLDCCVITDGGGAVVVVSEDVADDLERECVEVLGHGETIKSHDAGRVDLTYTGARQSGREAYAEAGVEPDDIDYVSLYDSFTITVLESLEDLGFCEKGEGGSFVEGGTLKAPYGDLPFNTDGGGLCSNHPDRGGMTKMIEAVRQLRGEANPEVQIESPKIALAQGTGGQHGRGIDRHHSSTLILGREDR